MSIFEFSDYRAFIKKSLSLKPKSGRGELSKIAEHLGVHSTLISLIMNGDRELTLEQCFDLSQYFELNELETEYFSLLVQLSRAGNHRYQLFIKNKLKALKTEAQKISHRFTHDKVLSEEQKSIFYSSWIYSAARLFTSTHENGKTLEEVVERFDSPRPEILKVLNFLISAGLIEFEKDRYKMGAQRTFLAQGSPHLNKHHSNWRIKAIQKFDRLNEQELMFTSPISISKTDFHKIREQMAEILKGVSQTVKDSPAEDIACLNIDLFWIDK